MSYLLVIYKYIGNESKGSRKLDWTHEAFVKRTVSRTWKGKCMEGENAVSNHKSVKELLSAYCEFLGSFLGASCSHHWEGLYSGISCLVIDHIFIKGILCTIQSYSSLWGHWIPFCFLIKMRKLQVPWDSHITMVSANAREATYIQVAFLNNLPCSVCVHVCALKYGLYTQRSRHRKTHGRSVRW